MSDLEMDVEQRPYPEKSRLDAFAETRIPNLGEPCHAAANQMPSITATNAPTPAEPVSEPARTPSPTANTPKSARINHITE